MESEIQKAPIQMPSQYAREPAAVRAEISEMAYEVYSDLYRGQTLERLNERGGFGIGELVAFLYARNFPRKEWSARVDEAFKGMRLGK